MHLGNGIICPVTGIPMLAIAGVTAFLAFKRVKGTKENFSKEEILKTLTLTALVFALQMINFAIPTTGSSGHIIGGVLLVALLGPNVAFLSMCAILFVQAVFFADGGLTTLGCNIFNMGFLACFVAYPFIYKTFEEKNKPVLGALLASFAALQLGSVAVVAEGFLSGTIESTSIINFAGLMQTIHLPIGITEGLITGAIIVLAKNIDAKKMSYIFGAASLLFAGIISHYASTKPDGLEWSLLNVSEAITEHTQGFLYNISTIIQAKTSILAEFSTMGNIIGLFAVCIIMFFICTLLKSQSVKINAQ